MYEGAQKLLRTFGANAAEIALAVPTLVGTTPASSYRDNPSVMIVIRGAQRGLNQLGAHLNVDGVLGAKTSAALIAVTGADYKNKKWIETYTNLLVAKQKGVKIKSQPSSSISPEEVVVEQPMTDNVPWPLLVAGGLGAYLLLRR